MDAIDVKYCADRKSCLNSRIHLYLLQRLGVFPWTMLCHLERFEIECIMILVKPQEVGKTSK